MKASIFILSFIFCASTICSQKDISFDFVSSLDQSGIYHNFVTKDSKGDPLPDFGVSSKFNFRIGADVSFNLRKGVYLKTGIRYARLGYKSFRVNIVNPSDLELGGETNTNLTVDDLFVEFPMVLRFESTSPEFQPYFECGVANNLYVISTLTDKTYSYRNIATVDSSNEIEGFNKIQRAFVFSVGFNYVWNRQFKLFCQPTYRYHLNKKSKNPGSYRFYSFGVEFGVRRFVDLRKQKDRK